jgi:von Willebrand factor type A domain
VRTLLPRSDINAGNIAALIGIARTQITNISARAWTPVGGGLKAAKDQLVAAPGSTNPKHIFLLSDGEENVRPLYADVKDEIKNAGVVVNTIAFGPEAPGDLMATIAADTGGIYRPVATNGIGSGLTAASVDATYAALAIGAISAIGAVDNVNAVLAASYLPGQLGLANVYDYFDTEAQGAARIFNGSYTNVEVRSVQTLTVNIDKSVNQLRLVVAGKQADHGTCGADDARRVEVFVHGPEAALVPHQPTAAGLHTGRVGHPEQRL